MSLRKKNDELQFLNYKFEMLERRMENIERLLMGSKGHHAPSDVGTNSELMQLVMTLVKQQMPSSTEHKKGPSDPIEEPKETPANTPDTSADPPNQTSRTSGLSSFDMGRRRLIA